MTTFKLKYLALLAISDLVMSIILDNDQVSSEFRQNKSTVSVKVSEKLQRNIYKCSYKDEGSKQQYMSYNCTRSE